MSEVRGPKSPFLTPEARRLKPAFKTPSATK